MSSTGKSSFFRQSGWMVISTSLGGIFMVSVQIATQNDRVNPARFRPGGFVSFEQGFPPPSRHTRSSSFRVTFILPVATRRVRI